MNSVVCIICTTTTTVTYIFHLWLVKIAKVKGLFWSISKLACVGINWNKKTTTKTYFIRTLHCLLVSWCLHHHYRHHRHYRHIILPPLTKLRLLQITKKVFHASSFCLLYLKLNKITFPMTPNTKKMIKY